MAAWAERRGFTTSVQERLFAADFKRQPEEPAIALCGLDNATGRRALDQVGFDLVVEAGMGRGHRDFRTMRLHLLPGRRSAAEMWKAAASSEKVEARPAYAQLVAEGVLDRCGMTLLAGKAVGAPFVGSVAACLALSEVLRLLHGGDLHGLIDLDLLSPDQRRVWRRSRRLQPLQSRVLNGWVIAAVRVGLVMSLWAARDQVAPARTETSPSNRGRRRTVGMEKALQGQKFLEMRRSALFGEWRL